MCGKEGTYKREWPKTQVFVGLEGRKPATVTRWGAGPHVEQIIEDWVGVVNITKVLALE